jgi:hypothetical protein
MPETAKGIYTYYPKQKNLFPEGGDAWSALNAGRQVAMNEGDMIVDVWDAKTKKTYDMLGNETGTRAVPYYKVVSESNAPFPGLDTETFYPDQRDEFAEGGDAWLLLNDGLQVTLDRRGMIIDVFDPFTGKKYDALGTEIGTRTDPFPSVNAIDALWKRCKALSRQIALLRAAIRALRGAISVQRTLMSTGLLALLRLRGQLLWQYGRLKRRKKLMDASGSRSKLPFQLKSMTSQTPKQ